MTLNPVRRVAKFEFSRDFQSNGPAGGLRSSEQRRGGCPPSRGVPAEKGETQLKLIREETTLFKYVQADTRGIIDFEI